MTFNSREDIIGCLDALQAADYPRLEIIVVDNASKDGTADLVGERYPSVRLVRNAANLGYGGGNNRGALAARGEVLLALNPDVQLAPDALRAFAAAFDTNALLGAAGAKLLFPDGRTLQHAGGVVEYPLATTYHLGYREEDKGQWDRRADVPYLTGAALAVRREVWDALGGFDAGFYPVYYEDVDLCYRVRAAGWRVTYIPEACGLHRTSSTLDQTSETYYRYYHANRLRFVLKHYSTQRLVADFLPAEAERLRGEMAGADRSASEQVFGRSWQVTAAMLGYEEKGHMVERSADEQAQARADLDAVVAELDKRWLVQEQPFASRVPLLGGLIAGFRSVWNSVSTKWYVRPMLQQQVEFNAAVARAVSLLAREVRASQTMATAGSALLGQRLINIEERLDKLEREAGKR